MGFHQKNSKPDKKGVHEDIGGASGLFESEVEDTPDWAKTLLLLLDYAVVECIERNLSSPVVHLSAAREELEQVVLSRGRS